MYPKGKSGISELVSGCLVLITAAVVLFLKRHVLAKAAALSIWSADRVFIADFLERPGGLLEYCGAFLTQTGHAPLLGILVMLMILAGIVLLCRKICGRTASALIPAACILLFWTGMDYNLHTMRAQGYVFSQMLGILAASAVIAAFQDSRHPVLFAVLALVIGYPVIGAYAVAAGLGITVSALFKIGPGKIAAPVAALCAVLVPFVCSHFIYSHLDTTYTFLAGMPYFDFNGNEWRWAPIVAACLSLILLPALKKAEDWKWVGNFSSIALSFLICAAIVLFSYKDKNFHEEIRMEQAVEANDWDKVLDIARKMDSPTRIGVMYRNIALLYKGEILESMFTYPDGESHINTKAPISMTMVSAPVSYFYYGMLQYSARWAMECTMLYQPGVQRYKYLAKAALFSGNEKPELIEKYFRIIEGNLFQKAWVRKYRAMLYDRSLLEQDEEYKMAMALNEYEEPSFMSSAVVENTILRLFASLEEPHGKVLELALASVLTVKKPELFWDKYDQWFKEGHPMTKVLAEAALLYAYMDRDEARLASVLDRIGGAESRTLKEFNAFSEAASRSRGAAVNEDYFRKRFGDTYWYYCYFVKELITD